MIIIDNYYDQSVIKGQKSIFLAGPTPREGEVESWRPEAIRILRQLGFDGVIYVPENKPDSYYDFDERTEWEWEALDSANVIAFWVPRQIDRQLKNLGMPAFTTNIEMGFYLAKSPAKVFYGRPDDAELNDYNDKLYQKQTGRQPINNLPDLMTTALQNITKE